MRPGWGFRDPALTALLEASVPAAVEEAAWANGKVPLRIAAYTAPADVPDDLIVSVRCVVQVRDRIVVCRNRDGWSHPWPGGRREPGETCVETACREVREETGWMLERTSVRQLGWLHFEHLKEQPPDHPWPHPDFLNLVFIGSAAGRVGGIDVEWTDTEGFELSSQTVTINDALAVGDTLSKAFLRLLLA